MQVDLDVWQSLVRFAAVGLVDRTGWNRSQMAKRLGKNASNFHMALFGRNGRIDEPLTKSFCHDLQRALHSIPDFRLPDLDSDGLQAASMLTTLYEELDESADPDPSLRIPAAWFPDLCAAGPARTMIEVLARGEALCDMLKDTQHRRERDLLLAGQNQDYAQRTIKDLLSITGLPPYHGAAAVHVLARLGAIVLPEVRKEIYRSPVGFRSIRVLGRMLWRIHLRGVEEAGDAELLGGIEKLLLEIHERPPLDPYPARSLYIEALRWSPASWEWVPGVLEQRALSSERPVRERVYAADVALRRGGIESGPIITALEEDAHTLQENGLGYAAAVLTAVRDGEAQNAWFEGVGRSPAVVELREWPVGQPETGFVNAVLARLAHFETGDVPPSVRDSVPVLLAEALLTLDGTRRRRACDVLIEAQLAGPATVAVAELITPSSRDRAVRPPRWLEEHAAFVLGYLQHHEAVSALRTVVTQPERYDPTVVHAAAWGFGDICGRGPWHSHRGHVPVQALGELVRGENDICRHAATYALAVTRQPEAAPIIGRLIENHGYDRLTRGLARWGRWLSETEQQQGRLDETVRIPSSRTLLYDG